MSHWDVWVLALDGDREPLRFVASPADDVNGRLSPDGRWMAYTSNEGGSYEVYVRPYSSGSGIWQVSHNGGYQPQWRADGREIYFLSPDRRLMAAPVSVQGASFVPGDPVALFSVGTSSWEALSTGSQYAPSPDGQRFLVNRKRPDAAALPITADINWMAYVDRRLGR
jgi:Tol biopolymer transport system component